jgi:RNA polymerase sigma-70 factor (ECF subfamily)
VVTQYQELLSFCLGKVKDAASDLAQESFTRVLSMQRAGQTILKSRALLKQVALRLKIDMDRRAEIRQYDNLDDFDESDMLALPAHFQPEEVYATRK